MIDSISKFSFSEITEILISIILVLLIITAVALLLSRSRLKKITDKLTESEAYYRSMFENSLYGIAITGPDFKFSKVNDAWCQLIGYSEKELLSGMGIIDVTLPDLIDESMKMIKKLVSGEIKEGRLEKRYKTKSGEIIEAMTFVRGIYDKKGEYLGNIASILEITELKRGELALKKSEAKYRRIFESVEDGYIFTDMEGIILSVNPATVKMLKYETPGLLVGKNMERNIYANAQQREDMLETLMEKGGVKGHLLDFKRQDGEVISAECNVHLIFDEANHPVAIEGTFRDVTERNRVQQELEKHRENLEELIEERTRELAETQKIARLGQWELDLKANKLHWSDEVFNIFEIDKDKFNASYEGFLNTIHPDDREEVNAAYTQSLEDRKPYEIIHRLLMKDGRIKYVWELCRTEYADDDTPQRSLGAVQDITELKRTEDQLKEANTKLKELDRLKSMFIASMSHEFRTPLNSIIGFTGILLMGKVGKLEPKQRDFLMRANQSSKHLLALINDVIDISKIEAGKIDTFNSSFKLDEVITEAVNDIEPLRDKNGLELQVNVPEDIEIHNDRKRVYQCILNFLSNAIKYSEKGRVSISARRQNGEVEIMVEDTGIGIAEEDLPRLFQQFERLDSPLRIKELGAGLGLYLTKKIASEILGGAVRAQSQLGVGSRFFLKIPMYRQSRENDNNPSSGEQS